MVLPHILGALLCFWNLLTRFLDCLASDACLSRKRKPLCPELTRCPSFSHQRTGSVACLLQCRDPCPLPEATEWNELTQECQAGGTFPWEVSASLPCLPLTHHTAHFSCLPFSPPSTSSQHIILGTELGAQKKVEGWSEARGALTTSSSSSAW